MSNQKKFMFAFIGATLGVSLVIGGQMIYKKVPKVSFAEYSKYCLFFAVLDDEICRNELDGNTVEGKEIVFPQKTESIHYRYKLFLETYIKFSKGELEQEMKRLEKRLEESKQYIGKAKEEITIAVQ